MKSTYGLVVTVLRYRLLKAVGKIRDKIIDRARQIPKKIKGQAYAKNFNVPYKKISVWLHRCGKNAPSHRSRS